MGARVGLLPLALLAAACASPTPTPTPITTASPEPSLHVGGLARVVVDELIAEPDPNEPPDPRFERRTFEKGDVLYLSEGPRSVDERILWRVTDERYSVGPVDWVPEANRLGVATLEPFAPECPAATLPIVAEALSRLGAIAALSCFGGGDVQVVDHLFCVNGVGDAPYFIGGVAWLEQQATVFCTIGREPGQFRVQGQVLYDLLAASQPQALDGSYVLTGHFDDLGSAQCHWVPGNYGYTPLDQEYTASAVMSCRLHFVVTAAVKLSDA